MRHREPDSTLRSLPGAILLLALAYGCVAQGGFYDRQFRVLLILVVLAVVSAIALNAPRLEDLLCPTILAALGLSVWAAISALHAHHLSGALPTIGLMGMLGAIVLTIRRGGLVVREQLGIGLLLAGMGVAMAGWFGVVARSAPWGIDDQGLWRAASPITYANATAALLAMLALVALARVVEEPTERLTSLAAFVLVTGLAATLSRAGVLAFALGLVVLGARSGFRRFFAATWAVGAGSLIAIAGLVPSLPAHSPPRPALAWAASIAGAAIALLSPKLVAKRRVVAPLLLVLSIAIGGVALGHEFRRDLSPRLNATSQARSDEWRATFRIVREHPFWGDGPGHFRLYYVAHDGAEVTAEFTHNELLQAWAELGSVGLALILGGVAFVVVTLARQRRDQRIEPWLWSGAPAALTALAVHSTLDYVWHIPVILAVGAMITGLAVTAWDDVSPRGM